MKKGISKDECVRNKIREYLIGQCKEDLPATFADFRSKQPSLIITNKSFKQNLHHLKQKLSKNPIWKQWYDAGRRSKTNLTPLEIQHYFPKKIYPRVVMGPVFNYLNVQCKNGSPATFPHFHAINPSNPISRNGFWQVVNYLRSDFTGDPAKEYWYDHIRLNKNNLTPEQLSLYFPKRTRASSMIQDVRAYLNEQCRVARPGTYAGFYAKNPQTKITNDKFCTIVSKLGIEFTDNPEREHWFNTVRLNREHLSPDELEFFFPKRGFKGTKMDLIRQYLTEKCREHLPASYQDFCETHPEMNIPVKSFQHHIRLLKPEFDGRPAKQQWFEEFFPRVLMDRKEDVQQVLDFLDGKFRNRLPAGWAEFKAIHPDLPYHVFSYGTINWKKMQKGNTEVKKWYNEVRTQGYAFTSKVGTFLDRCVIADLYSALKIRRIPLYNQTTGFASLGYHPGVKRWKKDKRIEGRLLVKDLLTHWSEIGLALRQYLMDTKRTELAFDITLSGPAIFGIKIIKYSDQTTCLLIITPEGMHGQRFLDPAVRVLSYKEFAGPNWLNLDDLTCNVLHDDFTCARQALWGGPASPAFRELNERTGRKWDSVKKEIKTKASQDAYELRVGFEITDTLHKGCMPKELENYLNNARKSGHVDFAERIETLSKAMAALGLYIHQEPVPDPKTGSLSKYRLVDPVLIKSRKTDEKVAFQNKNIAKQREQWEHDTFPDKSPEPPLTGKVGDDWLMDLAHKPIPEIIDSDAHLVPEIREEKRIKDASHEKKPESYNADKGAADNQRAEGYNSGKNRSNPDKTREEGPDMRSHERCRR